MEESNKAKLEAFRASWDETFSSSLPISAFNDARVDACSTSSSPTLSQISCRDFMVGAGGPAGARAPCANNPVQVILLTKRAVKTVREPFAFMASL